MADIKSPTLLYIKGGMFLGIGILASLGLLLKHPEIKVAVLLGLAVWGFSRAYYFAFYVIQHYIDPSFKFAGLTHFLRYWLSQTRKKP